MPCCDCCAPCAVCGSDAFERAVDAGLVVNLVALGALTHRVAASADEAPLAAGGAGMPGWPPLFYTVTTLFMLELAAKAATQPWRRFKRGKTNQFDCLVTLGMVVCAVGVTTEQLPAAGEAAGASGWVRTAVLMQVLGRVCACSYPVRVHQPTTPSRVCARTGRFNMSQDSIVSSGSSTTASPWRWRWAGCCSQACTCSGK